MTHHKKSDEHKKRRKRHLLGGVLTTLLLFFVGWFVPSDFSHWLFKAAELVAAATVHFIYFGGVES